MFPLCAAPARISNAAIAFLLVGAALLVLAAIYTFQAVRSRGKPPVERRGTLNLGDQLFSDWAAGPHAIDPTPGTFSLYGRKDPNALEDPEPDPRRR